MTFRSLRHPVTHLINTACRTRSMERDRAAQGMELSTRGKEARAARGRSARFVAVQRRAARPPGCAAAQKP
eukprot:scaffold854_cov343-Prasinococcus_capsulatus_cf.AAC.5